MLDPIIKAAWIAWLRNPEHRQTQGMLKGRVGYCCLGGACEVILADKDAQSRLNIDPDRFEVLYNDIRINTKDAPLQLGQDYVAGTLPIWLRNKVGISDDEQQRLVAFNDDTRWSFSQIADWIEEHL